MKTVNLRRAYRFRLYPTKAQQAELSEWERQLRFLYNLAQEQRMLGLARWRRPKEPGQCISCGARSGEPHTQACAWVDYYRQGREMTELLRVNDQLARVVCSARQEVLRDLDKAWQRWRKGLGGWPRFKRQTDTCRVYFSTPKAWKVDERGLSFAGIASTVGTIKMRQDRPWPGDAVFTSCHVVRDVDQWYAVFPLAYSKVSLRPKGGSVGINRGAIHAIVDSNRRVVDSPKFYARALATIRKRSHDVDRKVPRGHVPKAPPVRYHGLDPAPVNAIAAALGVSPGRVVYEAKKHGGLEAAEGYLRDLPHAAPSAAERLPSLGRNQHKAKVRLACAHRKVRRQREFFLHNESAHYTKTYTTIAIEDLSVRKMTEERQEDEIRRVTRARNRSILDVGWYELSRQLQYKADATGARVVLVEPGPLPTESVVPPETLTARDTDRELPFLKGEAGISGTCSSCGAVLLASATGNELAHCQACLKLELGDINAATNVLKRALFATPPAPSRTKVTIQIKGRKVRSGDAPGSKT